MPTHSRNWRLTNDEIADKILSRIRVDENGCFNWIGSSSNGGYGLLYTASGRRERASRKSYEVFRGPIGAGMIVCHRCDNPPCVNPAHLFLGTHKDNTRDAIRKGRLAMGSRHGHAKLTEDVVREIRAMHQCGATLTEIRQRFNISAASVSNIYNRRRWTHVV